MALDDDLLVHLADIKRFLHTKDECAGGCAPETDEPVFITPEYRNSYPYIKNFSRQTGSLEWTGLVRIRRYLFPQARIFDLGCGTGLIEEQISSEVSLIHAVDQYPQFMEWAIPADNVTYIQGDAATFFHQNSRYDIIICFGVVCYLSDQEMLQMIRHCMGMLAPGGVIIIKGQWGL